MQKDSSFGSLGTTFPLLVMDALHYVDTAAAREHARPPCSVLASDGVFGSHRLRLTSVTTASLGPGISGNRMEEEQIDASCDQIEPCRPLIVSYSRFSSGGSVRFHEPTVAKPGAAIYSGVNAAIPTIMEFTSRFCMSCSSSSL